MCGIAGLLSFNLNVPKKEIIERMTSCLDHRGPDATGFFENDIVSMGHKRLSIIDPTNVANQPMSDNSGRYHIVFNGEIYNFREVRSLLHEYSFKTHGDTEVILAAYIKWGPECLQHFAGMFAFAIWDSELKELFIARDRFGVKPLYYFTSADFFLFGSEIRSLLAAGLIPKKLNPKAVSEFLQFESVGDSNTIIQDIFSLEAGYYMIVSRNENTRFKYWTLLNDGPDFNYDDSGQVKSKVNELLSKSIERRMVSDVPIGASLSGGIDSSAVVALMAKHSDTAINTFTIGFDEREFDESEYADLISQKFNTRHTRLLLQPQSFLDELVSALDSMDTPSGDGVNSYVVSKKIRETGITVALSGVGGDELFAGYPIFFQYLKLNRLKNFWKVSSVGRIAVSRLLKSNVNSKKNRYGQMIGAAEPDIQNLYPSFRQIISKEMMKKFTSFDTNNINYLSEDFSENKEQVSRLPLLSQVSVAEYSGYTRNTLLKDMDQMSMAVSLECREPFFDHELVNFVLHVPDHIKYQKFPKSLLVESLGDMLPSQIVHRKKQGFVFPWNNWMKNELRDFCNKYIVDISTRDFMHGKELLAMWNKFLNNDPTVRWKEIWVFVALEYWLQKNEVA